jgi:hypothetical protein
MSLVIASYGGGTNSTAMLIECAKRNIQVDLILFADTGGEKPHTLEYVKRFSQWLVEHDMPEIVTVKKVRRNGEVLTLEQNCREQNMLPSIAYGFKSCSQKYKIQPQDKYVNNWQPAKDEWAAGRKITKLIGYDADEDHRAKIPEDKKYQYEYPLVEWDMGREECLDTIDEVGLCPPGKSACYFCPSSKPSEIRQLAHTHPELIERALAMEANAELTSVKGLGRNFAWRDLLANGEMFDDEYSHTPELVCGCYDG